MCGLAGILDLGGRVGVSKALLLEMRDTLTHRGPDGCGHFLQRSIGLAHRRLAVVDLEGGHQPLFNEDGRVCVVFNGEIYNAPRLAEELELAGHVFRTRSDTEAIVHAWEEWGPNCISRFQGMFAFALWDSRSETLFLARDRLGKKPLYYTWLTDGRLLFASELKALLACPQTSRRIDPQAVEDYLCYGYVPDPRSIYADVCKLPPAHWLICRRDGSPKIERYWRPVLSDDRSINGRDAAEELRERFRQAVAARLIADVPLGAFLSGGVDSSGVVALMAELAREPVNTFSIAFNEPGFDESSYARVIADRYRTRHSVGSVDPQDTSLLDRLPAIFDEPFGDNSAIPTYQVCALARRGVTVALSGDGGDELFAGYRRYLWHVREAWLRNLLPDFVRKRLFGFLGAAYPKLDWAPRFLRAKTTFGELAGDEADAFTNSVSVIGRSLRHDLYSPAFRRDLQGYDASLVVRRHMEDADTDHPLLQVQYADMMTWLPGDILTKVDRTSMAVSLEVRAPLLDHQLVEWSAKLPVGLKINGSEGKYVLKRSLEPLVPRHLLYRPKQGFSSPLAAWFRGPLAGRMQEAAHRLGESGFLDGDRVAALLSQHRRGQRNHGPALWSLLMFDAFLRHHAGLSTAPRHTDEEQAVAE